MSDNKAQKFKDIAERRVNSALNQLRLIGNLSNKNNYDYTQDDVNKIYAALFSELKALKARFESTESGSGPAFKL